MSIACHVYLPPFLFFLTVFFTITIFAIAIFISALLAGLELEVWGFLGRLKSFDWRVFVHTTS